MKCYLGMCMLNCINHIFADNKKEEKWKLLKNTHSHDEIASMIKAENIPHSHQPNVDITISLASCKEIKRCHYFTSLTLGNDIAYSNNH